MIVAAIDRQRAEVPVVREGRALADALGCDLHVLHVHASRTAGMKGLDDLAAERAETIAREAIEEFEAVGRVGDIATEIVEYARERDATFVVVGGRARSAVGKAILGSVSQSVVLQADQPVVTVPKR